MSINFQNTKLKRFLLFFMRLQCMSFKPKSISVAMQSRHDSCDFDINICMSKVIQYVSLYSISNKSVQNFHRHFLHPNAGDNNICGVTNIIRPIHFKTIKKDYMNVIVNKKDYTS